MADNFTFKDASGSTKTAASTDTGSVHIPKNQLVDSSGTAIPYADGATFTRGSSKLLAGLAGIYESTVSTLTAGKVALARLTSRGAVVVRNSDPVQEYAYSAAVGYKDLEVSTTNWSSGYGTPTAAFFNGADAGFNATTKFIRIPMKNHRGCGFVIEETLDVSVTITVYVILHDTSLGTARIQLYTAALGGKTEFWPFGGETGVSSNLKVIPALQSSPYAFVIQLAFSGDPTSGSLFITTSRW